MLLPVTNLAVLRYAQSVCDGESIIRNRVVCSPRGKSRVTASWWGALLKAWTSGRQGRNWKEGCLVRDWSESSRKKVAFPSFRRQTAFHINSPGSLNKFQAPRASIMVCFSLEALFLPETAILVAETDIFNTSRSNRRRSSTKAPPKRRARMRAWQPSSVPSPLATW